MKLQRYIKQMLASLIVVLNLTTAGYAQPIQTISFPNDHNFPPVVALSQDGSLLLTALERVNIWNVNRGEMVSEFNQIVESSGVDGVLSGNTITSAAFSPKGDLVFTVHADFRGKLWELSSGKIIYEVTTATAFLDKEERRFLSISGMTGIAFTPDGTKLLTGDVSGAVQLWNAVTGEEIRTLHRVGDGNFSFNAASNVKSLKILPSGDLALIQDSNEARLFDLQTGLEIQTIPGLVALSADWSVYFTTSPSRRFVERITGRIIKEFPAVTDIDDPVVSPLSVDISPDGRFAVMGGITATVGFNGNSANRRIFDSISGNVVREFPLNPSRAQTAPEPDSTDWVVKFFPDGKRFLTVNGNNVHIWDISDLTTGIPNAAVYDN